MTFETPENFKYSAHGMDVVTSSQNPNELYFYLVNHRTPAQGDPKKVGADSVIEVFKSVSPAIGGKASEKLNWIKTYKSEYIHTPNDVVGSPDGKSFYVTNDHSKAVGAVSYSTHYRMEKLMHFSIVEATRRSTPTSSNNSRILS